MKRFSIIIFSLILSACTLNSTQEKSLQQALNEYIETHNEGKVVGFASMTHPSVLRYYNNLGAEAFSQQFELVDTSYNSSIWSDAIIRSTEKSGEKIHVLYRLKEVSTQENAKVKNIHIVAISEDNGQNWLFLKEKDYQNGLIFNKEEKLFLSVDFDK